MGKNESGQGITPHATPRPEVDSMAQGNPLRAVPLSDVSDLRIVAPRTDLSDAKHTYALCRALGHSWVHRGVDREAYDGAMVALRSECSHCGMVRRVFRTPRGFRASDVHNRYIPPPDYADRGEDKLQRHEWTQLLLSDVLPVMPSRPRRKRTRRGA